MSLKLNSLAPALFGFVLLCVTAPAPKAYAAILTVDVSGFVSDTPEGFGVIPAGYDYYGLFGEPADLGLTPFSAVFNFNDQIPGVANDYENGNYVLGGTNVNPGSASLTIGSKTLISDFPVGVGLGYIIKRSNPGVVGIELSELLGNTTNSGQLFISLGGIPTSFSGDLYVPVSYMYPIAVDAGSFDYSQAASFEYEEYLPLYVESADLIVSGTPGVVTFISSGVPEPSTWVFMIAGTLFIGALGRSRRRRMVV